MSVRVSQRPLYTLHDLKTEIVSSSNLWGTAASVAGIAELSAADPAWEGDCIPHLTANGFVVPSPHGLVFARFDNETCDQRRVVLASMEAVAAARAIKRTARTRKYNFPALTRALSVAIAQVDPLETARMSTAILSCLFDIADLPQLGGLHRIHASEAVLYAWANKLDSAGLERLGANATLLLNAVKAGDEAAISYAAAFRDLGQNVPLIPNKRIAA